MQTFLYSLKYLHYWFARQSITKLPIALTNMLVQSLAVHFSIPLSFSLNSPFFLFLCTCPDTYNTPYVLSSPKLSLLFLSLLIFLHLSYYLTVRGMFLSYSYGLISSLKMNLFVAGNEFQVTSCKYRVIRFTSVKAWHKCCLYLKIMFYSYGFIILNLWFMKALRIDCF